MVWAHEGIHLDELLKAAAAFLDMILLASGYQSSGRPVFWDPDGVRRALGWASFLEKAMQGFPATKDGDASKEVLDAALVVLMDEAPHPPGLPQLSCQALSQARRLLVAALIQAFGIGNGQLEWVVIATPELDVVGYLQQACKRNAGSSRKRSFGESQEKSGGNEESENGEGELVGVIVDELRARYMAKSCMDSLGRSMQSAAESVASSKAVNEHEISIWKQDGLSTAGSRFCAGPLIRTCLCERWCKEGLSYLTSAKTIYKLSGAKAIFDADKQLWTAVLNSLHKKPAPGLGSGSSPAAQDDEVVEVAELCLLYLASPEWKGIVKKLSTSLVPVSAALKPMQPEEWFVDSRPQSSFQESSELSSEKQKEVEEYMLGLLRSRPVIWWKLPPILAAAAAAATTSSANSGISKHYVETIAEHVDAKESSGICSCHSCCSRQCCKECKDAVHERTWTVLFLNGMQEEHVQVLQRLSIQACTFT